jgi:hypothetical protein
MMRQPHRFVYSTSDYGIVGTFPILVDFFMLLYVHVMRLPPPSYLITRSFQLHLILRFNCITFFISAFNNIGFSTIPMMRCIIL